jgi:hypothetical protein
MTHRTTPTISTSCITNCLPRFSTFICVCVGSVFLRMVYVRTSYLVGACNPARSDDGCVTATGKAQAQLPAGMRTARKRPRSCALVGVPASFLFSDVDWAPPLDTDG